MSLPLLIIEYIRAIISWPFITIITVIIFRKNINLFLKKITEIKVGSTGISAKTYSESLEMPETLSIGEKDKDELTNVLDKKQVISEPSPKVENIPEKLDENKMAEIQSNLNLTKHFIFNEIYFNCIEIIGYFDKLLGMWPFLKRQRDLMTMSLEQKINLLVSNNKLDSNAGRDVLNLYSYWFNNKDRINLIKDKDELLRNYTATKRLIIYLKSLI
ncbi:MAG: hypothetical protein ACYCSW_11225 [bacterium]